MRRSDSRFTASSVNSIPGDGENYFGRCYFCLNHFCHQRQVPLALLRNVETAIITIVSHTLLRGRHSRRNFCARSMSPFTVVAAGHPLERGQIPPLLIVSDIGLPTT
jgi:hypothetical protein